VRTRDATKTRPDGKKQGGKDKGHRKVAGTGRTNHHSTPTPLRAPANRVGSEATTVMDNGSGQHPPPPTATSDCSPTGKQVLMDDNDGDEGMTTAATNEDRD
jgi:hypothetical protein